MSDWQAIKPGTNTIKFLELQKLSKEDKEILKVLKEKHKYPMYYKFVDK